MTREGGRKGLTQNDTGSAKQNVARTTVKLMIDDCESDIVMIVMMSMRV